MKNFFRERRLIKNALEGKAGHPIYSDKENLRNALRRSDIELYMSICWVLWFPSPTLFFLLLPQKGLIAALGYIAIATGWFFGGMMLQKIHLMLRHPNAYISFSGEKSYK